MKNNYMRRQVEDEGSTMNMTAFQKMRSKLLKSTLTTHFNSQMRTGGGERWTGNWAQEGRVVILHFMK